MKVETFLQHCNSREKFTHEEEADARKFFVDRGVRYIRDWYSQPFNPELITELFEGIEHYFSDAHNNSNEYVTLDEKGNVQKTISTSQWFKHICFEGDEYQQPCGWEDLPQRIATLPLVLDEFISDCVRNGIELKWKEILTNKENQ
jgi:hypothetical protein